MEWLTAKINHALTHQEAPGLFSAHFHKLATYTATHPYALSAISFLLIYATIQVIRAKPHIQFIGLLFYFCLLPATLSKKGIDTIVLSYGALSLMIAFAVTSLQSNFLKRGMIVIITGYFFFINFFLRQNLTKEGILNTFYYEASITDNRNFLKEEMKQFLNDLPKDKQTVFGLFDHVYSESSYYYYFYNKVIYPLGRLSLQLLTTNKRLIFYDISNQEWYHGKEHTHYQDILDEKKFNNLLKTKKIDYLIFEHSPKAPPNYTDPIKNIIFNTPTLKLYKTFKSDMKQIYIFKILN